MGFRDWFTRENAAATKDDDDVSDADVKDGDYADVLKEMHRRWDYSTDKWQSIRDEGTTDMLYVSGDPWSSEDRLAREAAGRPILCFDELGQYVNQLINDIRQHKRAIKVTPVGYGAEAHTAEFRQNLIRQIEYRSNAQQAYTVMFENTVQRSYGFLRIKPRWTDNPTASGGTGGAFDQELVIDPLPNPDLVTIDPDILKPDGSDMSFAWIAESWAIQDYKRKWPKAKVRDFTTQLQKEAPSWIDAERIRIAEYWVKTTTERMLLLFKDIPDPQTGLPRDVEVFEDDLEQPKYAMLAKLPPSRRRMVEVPVVTQYLTNGFEVLGKPTVWPAPSIPLVCCFGKILYVDQGAGPERMILSLVRLARDPVMTLCYYVSSEAEAVGMTPRTPAVGYTGQFRGKEDEWQKVNHEPLAFLEVNPTTEGTGANILPLPQFRTYDPPVAALEIGKESARRAIQAAMGISPLPTQAQRRNEKSGKALQVMHDAEQQGSFHFIDSYESAVARTGTLLDELMDFYYDTARDVTVRTPADEPKMVRINDPSKERFPKDQEQAIHLGKGQFDVTLSTGPDSNSEREAASDFADTMMGTPLAPLFSDLVIKLKNLGPIGDEMAARAHAMLPPQIQALEKGQGMDPGQLIGIITALQQQLAQMQPLAEKGRVDLMKAQSADQTKQAIALHADKTKLDIAGIQGQATITAAEIKAMRDDVANQIEAFRLMLETEQERRLAAHEFGHRAGEHISTLVHETETQARQHEHEATMADQQAAQQAELAAQTAATADQSNV